ncbi:histidine utilization repressor [Salinivibrio proteolyticus]|uniref:Histidine utilization repressor n=1 Tax=Salinivibrio proteolyticus TaxID=334715 RepID=A0ABY7LFI7_9GAMM|nr:histidine utilization repressor [Salinivibrio proteolyticus]WBA15978.1 histidine utilization repressor [Salinivibrio proteolyticus]
MAKAPRFQQIKDYIVNKIEQQVWPVGARIPTEHELCAQFNVSRMTVNKAVRDLVNEGRLERTPRLGTFVTQPKAESPLMDIRNIADEVTARGQTYRSDIRTLKRISASADVAMRLGVMLGTDVFFSEIVHYADNVPLQLEQRWVNPALAPDYLHQDFSQHTPNEYLSQVCPVNTIEHTVEAIIASDSVRQALAMKADEPCLLLHRRTWSQQTLVSAALLYHPGARYKLTSRTDR